MTEEINYNLYKDPEWKKFLESKEAKLLEDLQEKWKNVEIDVKFDFKDQNR